MKLTRFSRLLASVLALWSGCCALCADAFAVTQMAAAGRDYSLALKSDGTMVAWGKNTYGQLGDGATTHRSRPVAVLGLTGVAAIAAGNHTVAIKSDDTVAVFGWSAFGQSGDGAVMQNLNPAALPDGLNLESASPVQAIDADRAPPAVLATDDANAENVAAIPDAAAGSSTDTGIADKLPGIAASQSGEAICNPGIRAEQPIGADKAGNRNTRAQEKSTSPARLR